MKSLLVPEAQQMRLQQYHLKHHLNVEGGNGCSRGGPRGYELSGVFENAVNVSDLSSVAS